MVSTLHTASVGGVANDTLHVSETIEVLHELSVVKICCCTESNKSQTSVGLYFCSFSISLCFVVVIGGDGCCCCSCC